MAKRSISSVMLNAKVLSVFLAVGLWIYVAGVRGPDTAKSLSADVMAINVPQGYVVSGALPSVTVTLRGPMNALWNVTNEYVTPTADLRGRTEGSSVVPVSVQIAGLSGVTVEQVEPRDVSIYLEKLETVSMAVTAELSGALPSGLVIGSIDIQPSTVLVSGPSSAISRVRDVSVSIALDRLGISAAGNISVAGDVSAYDAQEQVVTGVHLSPGTVAAILPVADAGTVRTVPVLPVVAGRIRSGYALIGVSCTPAVVMVRGGRESSMSCSLSRRCPSISVKIPDRHSTRSDSRCRKGLQWREESSKSRVRFSWNPSSCSQYRKSSWRYGAPAVAGRHPPR